MVNQTMDIYTLGAVPPYNQLLAGNLAVYAAASREVREAYQGRYCEAVTQIESQVLPAHLVMLTTTSAFSRSSLYNRIRYRGREVAQRLGETTGYGNVRLNAVRDIYPQIKEFLVQEGYEERMGFGKGGPKEAWRNIIQVMQMLGIKGGRRSQPRHQARSMGDPVGEKRLGLSQWPEPATGLLPGLVRPTCPTLEKKMDAAPQRTATRWRLAQLGTGTNPLHDHPGGGPLNPCKGQPSKQNLEVTVAWFSVHHGRQFPTGGPSSYPRLPGPDGPQR